MLFHDAIVRTFTSSKALSLISTENKELALRKKGESGLWTASEL
jgi:hypothetical protein